MTYKPYAAPVSGPRAKKRFGQHFLVDELVIQDIISAVAPLESEHVVEIGPGTGVLTDALLRSGARIDAIEYDRDLIPVLAKKFNAYSNFRLFEGDALTFDYSSLNAAGNLLRVVGNLPYNISTPLLFRFLEIRDSLSDLSLMLQKEVAARIAATPGNADYGRLSVMLQAYFEVVELFDVEPSAFAPPPKVRSHVLQLVPRSRAATPTDFKQLEKLVALAFSQRRKMLRHTLGRQLSADILGSSGISSQMRAEEVSVAQFVNLSNTTAG